MPLMFAGPAPRTRDLRETSVLPRLKARCPSRWRGTLAVTIGLAAINPGSDSKATDRREIEIVQAAADGHSYDTVNDAWMQARLGATAALSAIAESVELAHLATHQDDDAIILTFAGHGGHCIDLLSRPEGNSVETRDC